MTDEGHGRKAQRLLTKNKSAAGLHQRSAEKTVTMTAISPKAIIPVQNQRHFHELQKHNIELERRNEELVRTQSTLARYFDLYELAPVGYVTVGEPGGIIEANLYAATLLGVPKDTLPRQPLTRFIVSEDLEIYYRYRLQLFVNREPQVCDLRLMRPDGSQFCARLDSTVVANEESGSSVCRTTIIDISATRQRGAALQDDSTNLMVMLHDREKEMAKLAGALQEAGAGLTAMLRRRDQEKEELRDQVMDALKKLVLPSLERLKRSGLSERQLRHLQTVEANLGGIVTPLGREVLAVPPSLTKMEMQVANFIKQGKKPEKSHCFLIFPRERSKPTAIISEKKYVSNPGI